MAIAGAVRTRAGSPLGGFARPLKAALGGGLDLWRAVESLLFARDSSGPLRGLHLDHRTRLSRTFAALVETFERLRNKGRQTVVVQHVYPGGQAVGHVSMKPRSRER
jgi:hypothetical protein